MGEFDYLASIRDESVRETATDIIDEIFEKAFALFKGMYQGNIPLTHDVYLKLYEKKGSILTSS